MCLQTVAVVVFDLNCLKVGAIDVLLPLVVFADRCRRCFDLNCLKVGAIAVRLPSSSAILTPLFGLQTVAVVVFDPNCPKVGAIAVRLPSAAILTPLFMFADCCL